MAALRATGEPLGRDGAGDGTGDRTGVGGGGGVPLCALSTVSPLCWEGSPGGLLAGWSVTLHFCEGQ